jgi:hypothetical protein
MTLVLVDASDDLAISEDVVVVLASLAGRGRRGRTIRLVAGRSLTCRIHRPDL